MMASNKTVHGAGFQLIIHSGSVSAKVRQAVLEGLEGVSRNYKQQIIKNISLDDHTLEELRKLGYPYARGKPANTLHGDDRMVHIQTGELRDSIRANPPGEVTTHKFVVYITSSAPHMPWLIYGTATMRPRRFHEKAYEEIKEKFWDPVLKALRKVEHRIGEFNVEFRR